MSINVVSIDHINMVVKSLDETVKFYHSLFGFTVRKDQPEERSKIVGNDSVKLCLYEGEGSGNREGIVHFGFFVSNFDDIVDKCKEMGVKMPYGIVNWGASRSVYITDPNGYEIELSENNGGGI